MRRAGALLIPTNSPRIVSFSGIDGAGKSTQIQALQLRLREQGFRTLVLGFWNDVVVFPHFREFMSLKAFKGDVGVGSPDKPVERRDKNVISWYMTAARLFFYLLDALSLRWTLWQLSPQIDFVVFDRYIYDELVNLPLSHGLLRFYMKLVLAISPCPTAAFLIDADPDAAYARKPEYPVEFLRQNRAAYLSLSSSVPQIKVVAFDSIDAMTLTILNSLSQHASSSNTRVVALSLPRSPRGEDAKSVIS